MRNFARLAAFAAAVLAAVPAGAATMTFSTVLTPDQEVVESGHMHGGQTHGHGGDVRSDAFGAGTLTLTTTGDRFSFAYDVDFNSALDFGFMRTNTPGSEIPADRLNAVSGVHIHAAPRGQNGPVVYGLFNPLQDFFGKPVSLFTARDGTAHLSGAWDSGDGDFEFSKGLVNLLTSAKPGEDVPLYFNVHTVGFPAGEIRGQIVATSPAPIPVPAPLPLLLGGLAVLGLVGRRRQATA